MTFHSPHLLWLLVPLVLLFSWELARHTASAAATWPKIARAWAGAFDVSLGTRHTTAETRPRIWLWFGLALCLIALARPQWGTVEEQVFDQSREVLIAVDLSKSMLAQDVKPSRLDRSKLLIQSLLDGLKGERVGLVMFAGTAFLQSPLSADYEILREFLPAMNPEYLPEGGSNYKAMLETSIQAFGTSTADRYLIILSDGESTEETWKSLTDSLKTKGIRVIGLGVGTAQGSFIPDAAGGFVKDERGAVVLSRLNSSTLQELAQVTGGAYIDASTWVDLPGLLQRTVEAGRKGEFSEKNTARMIERYQWFLAPGLLLLLISFWAEFPVRPRERALPLGKARSQSTENRGPRTAVATAALVLLSSVLCPPSSVRGAEGASPGDPLAKPLSTTVARLAEKPGLSAKDCSELAQTTLTYGQRVKSAQQHAPETVIRDALQGVDLGEKLDPQAADWPKLRAELEELLKKEEPPPQDKKDQDKQKQDQQQQDQQQQQNQDQQKSDEQKQQDQQEQQQQEQQQQKQNQNAFGDMKDQQDQKKDQPAEQKPQPPKPGTQKVGGRQDKKPEEQEQNPDLAMPLQKLDQVRNQDSPAKLQQIMQGQQTKPKTPGKDW
jgi:Ca-activated chloride channel family protein